ncbi:hypothetical protein I7I53_02269 [Histoplasma capsulatum var. duboisii H88]|uniref:Uncharacterized protein n=1 Tax=Ajellomyces capsulatus (strain H88) TaxID=544711 RepID=A0A8A1LQE6_AJEC8|nr:hypothetical protein I7I53_02269 [Histoplasma capsulatum var. duboisii H88]
MAVTSVASSYQKKYEYKNKTPSDLSGIFALQQAGASRFIRSFYDHVMSSQMNGRMNKHMIAMRCNAPRPHALPA